MRHASHRTTLPRLRRIEGQVRGVARMIEKERYCVDILIQLRAIQAALAKVENRILKDHLEQCVEATIAGGDPETQRGKIAELMSVLDRRR